MHKAGNNNGDARKRYERPTVEVLGTLAELTLTASGLLLDAAGLGSL